MSKEFPGAKRGIGSTPLNGPVIETGEKITSLEPPAYQKKYPYKGSQREPAAVSDDVATRPVSMTPKRQVRASGDAPSASEDNISTPVSMTPVIRKS